MASVITKKTHKKHGKVKLIILTALIITGLIIWKNNSLYDYKRVALFNNNEYLDSSSNDTNDLQTLSPFDSGTYDPEMVDELYALAEDDHRINSVIENFDNYPDALLKLLIKNSEARDFVLEYPEHLNDKSIGEINNSELKSEIPHFLQWDERWGYHNYGSSVLGVTGCGPACLSMVIVGLTNDKDATPAAVADYSAENGFYVTGAGTSWDLMLSGASNFGLSSTVVPLSEDSMISELENGHPLIVNLGPGDFTDYGHFIVIIDYENGMFIVNDPNSKKLSDEGWYYSTLEPQIKNIWAFSVS